MLETALAIVVGAAWACYLVWKWQEAAFAPPPYQPPVEDKTESVEQEAPNTETVLNPKAAWPFPTSTKP
jgi:hypothetical protein